MKDAEYTQKLRIDIPLYNYDSNIDPSIKARNVDEKKSNSGNYICHYNNRLT